MYCQSNYKKAGKIHGTYHTDGEMRMLYKIYIENPQEYNRFRDIGVSEEEE
jgi:hypothetical protein